SRIRPRSGRPSWWCLVLVVRVAGIVRWDHRSFASADGQFPAVERLLAVMEVARSLEVVDPGVVGLRPRGAMVELQPAAVAALHDAHRLPEQDRHLLR